MSAVAMLAEALRVRSPRIVEDPSRRQAAVAIILAPEPDQVLLIRRAVSERDPWSGQMGLPGGRRDPGDPDLLATAVRETMEELGLDLGATELLGVLDDLVPTTPVLPPLIVRPHVFALPGLPAAFRLSAEVQYVRWAALGELRRPEVYRPYHLEHGGVSLVRPAYHLGNDVVWGMTERILTPLLGMAASARDALPPAHEGPTFEG
jgi:8-oxo-dGTP pyrophosphatase MutT (NUDIX family)